MPLSLQSLLKHKAKSILQFARSRTLSAAILKDIFGSILSFIGIIQNNNSHLLYSRFSKIILNASKNGYITELYILDIFDQLIHLSKQK